MNLEVHVEEQENKNVLQAEGEIDAYTAPQLRDALLPLTEKPGVKNIVDLSGIHYIDSTGLGIFIGALKSANEHKSFLELTGLNQRVKRLFSITGLDEVIDIDEGEREEANNG